MADPDGVAELVAALGEELQILRRRRKLSREQLAEKVGVSATTIGRIEREGPVDVSTTWRIADALDVDLARLISAAERAARGAVPGRRRREVERQLAELNDVMDGGGLAGTVARQIVRRRDPAISARLERIRERLEEELRLAFDEESMSEDADRPDDALAADPGDDAAGESESYNEP